ncbi:hypothetical protein [Actinoallomurus sp. NPDC050550]|uniref:hypothetical protein n=1 Tax=Actinoallomurus sp. NPDC050550 TaxID=3154937 RepID=UPI0033C86EE3
MRKNQATIRPRRVVVESSGDRRAIAHRALDEDLSLRDAALRSGVGRELYERVVVREKLTRPGVADADGRTASSGHARHDRT